ncbi:hypothetical protein R1sor_013364 [Riccia sorocarpa]|uniref:Cytochrome P450 n=1 Tax=Riccia sorocarpa TaxID=122646 RepID=A0ABD3H9L3_9MARC
MNCSEMLSVGNFVLYVGGFLILLLFWRSFGSWKKLRLPPGPPGWPLLGHLPILGSRPHLALLDLSRKYGPLMSIRMGTAPGVVASSPEMARIFLKTQDLLFATRPKTVNGEVFFYNFTDVGFAQYNEHWRFARRIFDTEMSSQKRLTNSKNLRYEEIKATVERILSYFDEKVSCANPQEESVHLPSLMDEWSAISGGFFVAEYIPFLRKLDLGGFEARLLKLRKRFSSFLDPIIEEHRQKGRGEAQDFLDVLLSLQRDGAGDGITDEMIKALLQDMLLAGTETDAKTMTWAFSELMRHPEVQQKLLDELDAVVGRDRLVEHSDLPNLKYLKATVKEVFRMYPVVTLSLPHEAMENTTVAGYDILKGTRLIVNAYAIGRDPNIWTNPNSFDPERFVGNSIDVRGHHFELLPFGAGRRQCPGMEIALDRVELSLAQVLQTCVLSLPLGVEVDMEEGVGLTMPRAHPLNVLVSPRLQPDVYSKNGIKF